MSGAQVLVLVWMSCLLLGAESAARMESGVAHGAGGWASELWLSIWVLQGIFYG